MGLQYFDVMKSLASGDSTKWVVPVEFTRFLRGALSDGSSAESGAK